jgi:hypothetical protein
MSIKDLLNSRLKESQPQRDTAVIKKDSVELIKPDTITRRDRPAILDSLTGKQPAPANKGVVNTDNYVFEDEVVKQNQPEETSSPGL